MEGKSFGAPARPARRPSVLARRPLVSYFLIAFAFTWALLFSVLLSKDGLGLLPYGVSPAMARLIAPASLLGPSVAALVVTGATEGWAGIGRLLRRIVRWRVGLRWYLFVLLGLPAVMVVGTLLRPGALASFDVSALPSAIAYLGAFVLMVVLGGPLFEEPGWRGFALPRLQRLHGPLVGGLILGSLWALWHLPGFLVPQKLPPSGTVMDFVRFSLALIALAYIIQWVVNNTGGSVLMAILTHATWNTFYSAALVEVFPAPAVVGSYLNLTIAAGALALVLLALTRGRLGYRPEASEAPRVR
jgi:CAAX protease family protein